MQPNNQNPGQQPNPAPSPGPMQQNGPGVAPAFGQTPTPPPSPAQPSSGFGTGPASSPAPTPPPNPSPMQGPNSPSQPTLSSNQPPAFNANAGSAQPPQAPQGLQFGQAAAPESGAGLNKKLLIIAGAAVCLLAVGAVAAVVIMNESDKPPQTSSLPAYDDASGAEEPAEIPKPTEVTINKSFQDELGYKTTVTKMYRNYPGINEYDRKSRAEENRELILVGYTIENTGSGGVSGGSPTPMRLKIKSGDGKEHTMSFVISEEELKAAGYPQLPIESPESGESKTGYILYEVPKDDAKLSVYYHQNVSVIGGDDVDKEFTLNLY